MAAAPATPLMEPRVDGVDPPAAAAAYTDDAMWEGDLQHRSLFLDRKEEVRGERRAYLAAHPEVAAMTADFLQHLLETKPADVYAAARAWFGAHR